MARVAETGEAIISSEIAKLHFNGNGNSLGWVEVLTVTGTDEPTLALHRLLAQEMARFSGLEGKVRRLFGGRPALANLGSSPVSGCFHRGSAERVTSAGIPVFILEFDADGRAFNPDQQNALVEWMRPLWGQRPRIVTAVHSLPGSTDLDAWFLGAFGRALDAVLTGPQSITDDRLKAGVYFAWQRVEGRWIHRPPLRKMYGDQYMANKIIMSCQGMVELSHCQI